MGQSLRKYMVAHVVAVIMLPIQSSIAAESTTVRRIDEAALKACLFIEDDQLRLRCFDQETGREHLLAKPEAGVEAKRLGSGVVLFKETPSETLSWLDRRWELSPSSKRGTFTIKPHQPVYLMPVYYNANPNKSPTSQNPLNRVATPENLQSTEAKFQLSLKTKVLENLIGDNGDVWFAYTQSSRWQLYNSAISKPFRETNYEPEAIFTWRTSWREFAELTGWNPRLLGLSINHQSNGRALPLSRSWNRLITMVGLERENTMVQLRGWARFPENPATDDNPDISDYMGRGEILVVHKDAGHEYSLLVRHNLRSGDDSRGGVQFDWAYPISSNLRGHIQLFSGYGESLIDYNHRSDYLGLGVSLVSWY